MELLTLNTNYLKQASVEKALHIALTQRLAG